MGVTTQLMTFEEFERLPDEAGKLELLDGELIRLPPAKTRHVKVSHRLYEILKKALFAAHEAAQAYDLGEVYMEMGYRIAGGWLQPDVNIAHAAQPETDYLEGAPALAAEVISESSTAEQMERKVRTYLANGGREVWLLYPRTKSVWIYRGKSAVETEGTLTSELLPEASIDLAEIFG